MHHTAKTSVKSKSKALECPFHIGMCKFVLTGKKLCVPLLMLFSIEHVQQAYTQMRADRQTMQKERAESVSWQGSSITTVQR